MGKNLINKKPIIGFLTLQSTLKETSYHILKDDYASAIIQAGGIPLLISAEKKLLGESLSCIDGILIEGGPDVYPHFYNEEIHQKTKFVKERDEFEIPLIQEAYKKNIPIFAICRGIQVLNVALGGTLWQDIPSQYKKPLNHNCKLEPISHSILIYESSILYKIFCKKIVKVNSSHHQAVKDIAPHLVVSAKSTDGVIEAIEGNKKKFVLGIQWHPERLYRKYPIHFKLFQFFVNVCKK